MELVSILLYDLSFPFMGAAFSDGKRVLQNKLEGGNAEQANAKLFADIKNPVTTLRSLYMRQEMRLSMEVTLDAERVALQGKADYSLWYGSYSKIECNVGIVEAKRIGQHLHGVVQCKAYMGKLALKSCPAR